MTTAAHRGSVGDARTAHAPGAADIDDVYAVFTPDERRASSADYATLIPGAAEVVAALRARGLKIGSTTGYTRDIMARPAAARRRRRATPRTTSFAPATSPAGRPTPLMMYRCFADLGVFPPWRGRQGRRHRARHRRRQGGRHLDGGVAVSGNALGLSEEEWAALPGRTNESRGARPPAIAAARRRRLRDRQRRRPHAGHRRHRGAARARRAAVRDTSR